jgi:Ca-activated chloride channel homolog
LKAIAAILVVLLLHSSTFAQYYLKGQVSNEVNEPLANAKILSHSSGYVYYSGPSGGFGITHNQVADSVTITLIGYQPLSVKLQHGSYAYLKLKVLLSAGSTQKNRLISATKNMPWSERRNWTIGGETYTNLLENEFINAKKFPETGFAISTDKASYSNIRRFINMNTTVPPDAIRIEEMLNYFNFGYTPPPSKDTTFCIEPQLSSFPTSSNKSQLFFLKVCAQKLNLDTLPASNLVFLIDVSGSMDMPNRLPLLKEAFALMVNNLREKDTVSIVVYGGTVGVWLQPTGGKEKNKIIKAIEELTPGGATPGASGIATAYRLATSQFVKNGNNRVILATDGDFNVGQTGEEELEKMIVKHQKSGIYLTCLGVGMGNYKDSKLEVLAKKGNGNFAYLDNQKEAEKVLVKELTQTLYAVADDAYLDIQFNPSLVESYRLIGFDNKLNAIADSSSQLEGGEVGSGQTLIALFELVPTPSTVVTNGVAYTETLATVHLHYKSPHTKTVQEILLNVPYAYTHFNNLPASYRFATAVANFGSLLKGSQYAKNIDFNEVLLMANQAVNLSDPLQTEFITLVEKAKKIYSNRKKRKGQE